MAEQGARNPNSIWNDDLEWGDGESLVVEDLLPAVLSGPIIHSEVVAPPAVKPRGWDGSDWS